jgi:hypothetical protein
LIPKDHMLVATLETGASQKVQSVNITPIIYNPQPWGYNLLGQWIGTYQNPDHNTDELINLQFVNGQLQATKVIGDQFVPAGKVTWQVTLTSPTTGTGQGQVAQAGYTQPQFVPGTLQVINDHQIQFTWNGTNSVIYNRHYALLPIHPTTPVSTSEFGNQLFGRWKGVYSVHGEEIIHIGSEGPNRLLATKITGDNNIPAGQITWRVTMDSQNHGVGQGQVAGPNFSAPTFLNGSLTVYNENEIEFFWQGIGSVKYHRE